jgi:WD40 repeat protein
LFFREIGSGGLYDHREDMILKLKLSVFGVERLNLLRKINFGEQFVNCVDFSDDESALGCGLKSGKVCVYDWRKNKFLFTYDSGHKWCMSQVSFLLIFFLFVEFLLEQKCQ